MMRRYYLIVMLILIPVMSVASPSDPAKKIIKNQPLITGSEIINASVVLPPYNIHTMDGVDIVGDTTKLGTTWWDNQHNGTIGRMVEKSTDGYLHFSWTNGLDYGGTQRNIYYNYIDPTGAQGWPGVGYPVESSVRSGYTTLDADYDGIAFPAFHWTNTPGGDHTTAVATDYYAHSGTFIVCETPQVIGVPEVVWPRVQFDNNQILQILSTEYPASGQPGDPQRHYYTTGTYDPVYFTISYEPWEEITWTMTVAADVATSEVSNRVAFAWNHCRDDGFPTPGGDYSQRNNDVYYLIDEDGVDPDWSQAINLTNFIPPDLGWLPDTIKADMDTLRAYTDISVFFDRNDYLHVAFTTPSYFELENVTYFHPSIIWHWSEQYPDEFVMIHNAFDDWWWNYTDCGAWNVKAQRPSLAEDLSSGNLYCAYQVYDVDTLAISAGNWPSGEIYVSVSSDGGMNWAEGTNVTGTITPLNAVPGECLSETYPSMAKLVDGECHIIYVLDYDAGNVLQTEGTWTENDVIYHKVPVGLISITPLVAQNVPFHVEHGPSAVEPGSGHGTLVSHFALDQNYPNPFNPTTSISFRLEQVSNVSLIVYNLKGEIVATLVSGTYMPGEHTVSFDGTNLPSGVYLYKLETGNRVLHRKMLLIK